MIEQAGMTKLIPAVSRLFSYSERGGFAHLVDTVIEDPKRAPAETLRFSDAYADCFDEESVLSSGHEERTIFELLQRFPSVIASRLDEHDAALFRSASKEARMGLLLQGYHDFCESSLDGEAVFNGTKQYRISQNVHGDVSIAALSYDEQGDLFPESAPVLPKRVREGGGAYIFMYQETVPLLVALCKQLQHSQLSKSEAAALIRSLAGLESVTPNAADVDCSNFAVDRAIHMLEPRKNGECFLDASGEYADIDVSLYAGHWE